MNGRSITTIARHAPSIGAYNKGLLKVTFKARMVISVNMSHPSETLKHITLDIALGQMYENNKIHRTKRTPPSDWCVSMSFVSTIAA
jgi:hypothetical protein